MVWTGSKVLKLSESGTKRLLKFRVSNFTFIKIHFPWTRCRDKRMKKVLVETLTVAEFFFRNFHFILGHFCLTQPKTINTLKGSKFFLGLLPT